MSFGSATQNSVAVGVAGIPTFVVNSGTLTPPPSPSKLLQENGFALLQEDGFYLLLE